MTVVSHLNMERPAHLSRVKRGSFWWLLNRPLSDGSGIRGKVKTGDFDLHGRELICIARYVGSSLGFKAVADKEGVSRGTLRTVLKAAGLLQTPKPTGNGVLSRDVKAIGKMNRKAWTGYWEQCESERKALAAIDYCWGSPNLSAEEKAERSRINARQQWVKMRHDKEFVRKKLAASREWGKANPERKRETQRRWLKANPEKNRQYRRKSQKNPRRKAINNLRKRLRDLVKAGMAVSVRRSEFIGCSPKFLITYLTHRFAEGMTWDNYGTVWHIDHVHPCAAFDLKKNSKVRECFHYTNLQPLFVAENRAKAAKINWQTVLPI